MGLPWQRVLASDSDSMLKSLTFCSSIRQASSTSLIFHWGNLWTVYFVRHSPWTDSTKVIKSIVYGFPVEEQQLSQEIVEKTEELLGMRPLLPQPTLTQAPLNIVLNLPKEQIIPQILEQVQKMAREFYESPESCASKSDVAGKLSTLSLYMRSLSLVELEQLESKILSASKSTGMKTMEQIFYDILSLVGTTPSTMLVIKKVKEGSLPTILLTKIVSYTIRNVRYPTQELMEELVKMVKSTVVRSHKPLYTTSLLQLSNLFYHC